MAAGGRLPQPPAGRAGLEPPSAVGAPHPLPVRPQTTGLRPSSRTPVASRWRARCVLVQRTEMPGDQAAPGRGTEREIAAPRMLARTLCPRRSRHALESRRARCRHTASRERVEHAGANPGDAEADRARHGGRRHRRGRGRRPRHWRREQRAHPARLGRAHEPGAMGPPAGLVRQVAGGAFGSRSNWRRGARTSWKPQREPPRSSAAREVCGGARAVQRRDV